MKFVVVAAVSVGVIAGPWTARGADAPRTVTGPAVSAAVDKAAKFLLSAQVGDNWEGSPTIEIYKQQVTGWTALAVDALLSAGVNSRDPAIDKAIKYLKSHQTDGIYALGLRMQVWQRLPPAPDVKAAARADLAKILANVGTKGDAAGMFTYYGPTKTAYSHSRTQYAIQGAAAARAMGLEVPDTFWKTTEAAWVDHQSADGGWTYTKANANGYPETAGMTTVALASLLLAHDALRQDETADCRGTVPDPAITKGLAWMSAHTDDLANDAKTPRAYPYYTLYGAERLGAAGGVKYFGSVNWYGKGAAWLLGDQGADGNWGSKTYTIDGSPAAFLDTCFALLFLARGRVPLFMQKLDYTPASAMVPAKGSTQLPRTEWNQRPRDASNLAAFAGRSLEQEFAWQRIPLSAPVADFHDAPILYLEGRDAVTFDAAAIAKFKAFIEDGGMIVANADCDGAAFANSIRKLGTSISPYEFRSLPATHPIFTRQQFPASRWKRHPAVLGLSNRVRELIILLPGGDPGKYWNAGSVLGREAEFQLGADLFQYVASRANLRDRGESNVVTIDPTVTTTAAEAIGRLKYADNWDPEPGGWRALAATMHNRDQLDLTVKTVTPADDWTGLSLVHLTGTESTKFLPALSNKVNQYVAAGGTLLVDAAGGSGLFAAAVEPQLSSWAGGGTLVPVPPDDPLFSAGGTPLGPVKYRPFAADARGKLTAPRLRGIKVGDRWAILYSDDDLSAGLVGQQVDGILGYDPATATEIARRIVKYAARK